MACSVTVLFCSLIVLLLLLITYIAAFYGVLQTSKALLIVTVSCAAEGPVFPYLSSHCWFFCQLISTLVLPPGSLISALKAFHSRSPSDFLHLHSHFSALRPVHHDFLCFFGCDSDSLNLLSQHWNLPSVWYLGFLESSFNSWCLNILVYGSYFPFPCMTNNFSFEEK